MTAQPEEVQLLPRCFKSLDFSTASTSWSFPPRFVPLMMDAKRIINPPSYCCWFLIGNPSFSEFDVTIVWPSHYVTLSSWALWERNMVKSSATMKCGKLWTYQDNRCRSSYHWRFVKVTASVLKVPFLYHFSFIVSAFKFAKVIYWMSLDGASSYKWSLYIDQMGLRGHYQEGVVCRYALQ